MQRPLRSHQHLVAGIVAAIAAGQTDLADILAAVTPGGGKSLLPVIAAARLIAGRRGASGSAGSCRATACACRPRRPSPTRPGARRSAMPLGAGRRERARPLPRAAGYVTTYQGIAAAPDLHLAEFRRHRYLLVVDEVHHLPALGRDRPAGRRTTRPAWSRAILPLLETARVRLLLSGTLERADGRAILWLPYRRRRGGPDPRGRPRGARAGRWSATAGPRRWPRRRCCRSASARWTARPSGWTRSGAGSGRTASPAAPRSRGRRCSRRCGPASPTTCCAGPSTPPATCGPPGAARLGIPAGRGRLGLGKLLVVAPDQENARRYLGWLRGWVPRAQADAGGAHRDLGRARTRAETLAAFRLRPRALHAGHGRAWPTRGWTRPRSRSCAALTHIRSRAWLEQMIARATRVDPAAGPYQEQSALVLHPDDLAVPPLPGADRARAGHARPRPQAAAGRASCRSTMAGERADPIVPLASNATALRWERLAPGPDFAAARPEQRLTQQADLLDLPVPARARAAAAGRASWSRPRWSRTRACCASRAAPVAHHAYSAALKRVMGKGRAEMSLAELEATVAWLERNRIADHLHLLEGDAKYAWTARQRRLDLGSDKRPRERTPKPSATASGP